MSESEQHSEFPEILPNDRHVLVVGGGEVAASRIYHLLNANAKITVISPTMNPEIEYRESKGLLYSVQRRQFVDSDLSLYEKPTPKLEKFDEEEYKNIDQYLKDSRFELVLVAIDDPIESKKIYYKCKLKGLNVNIADVPPLCDFYFGAIFRKGDLQVMVSTNGRGPRMARLIKDKIGNLFSDYEIDKTIGNIGELRKLLRIKNSGTDNQSIQDRMEWMTKTTDLYTFKQWSDVDIHKVIEYYPNLPPKYEDLK
ncbi:Siroheme synthase [Wickerhamomyces ciferrii]|uniref:precorrin-2 dehydrogenase n=1 Tax=Wickerhamomyces ciferrii (strain ATCC 14091 / BCRC 22168 / CBS 111 / JCM 3599 / NBRC 0793 / NRRL Y-1031 F-60-10) TaxID=1206466 RepID=K0KPH6_WICCF|nr:Siroheme synthase [Wickerhamomyces ciferrii]CCH44881.1 Siroheme synthase [Wickerhamomyces ciferrii]